MNIKKTIVLLFIFLFTNVYLFAQDKVVCRRKNKILEHSIEKKDSNVTISIFVDSFRLSIIQIPHKYYDMSDSIAIRIGKRMNADNNSWICYRVISNNIWDHLAMLLDPKFFPIKDEDNNLFYNIDIYYKDWELYDRLKNNNE